MKKIQKPLAKVSTIVDEKDDRKKGKSGERVNGE